MSSGRAGASLLAALVLAAGGLGPASARTEAQPKYGGTLVVGMSSGDAGALDPMVSSGLSASEILVSMCARLYDRDARAQPVPWLASRLPLLSKDRLTYTILLREGVLFNDGTPFDAQAVVTSVQRYMTDPASLRAAEYAAVDSVVAAGPYTVAFHLKRRDSTFTGDAIVLSPTQLAKLGTNIAAEPVCVGPFMFDHRVAGDSVTLIKSPYYFDQKRVFLDKIVYKAMPDAAAAAAALKAGDIHLLDAVSATQLPGIQQDSRLRVLKSPQHGWQGIFVNIGNHNGAGNPPYANTGTALASSAKLRQAFEEAIDRDTLNRVVFDGLYEPSCTPIAPTNAAWYDATRVACTPYDPGHARKLVAAAGIPNPTVRLLTANTTDNLRLAQFIQAQEAAVGIDVVIDATDNPTDMARRLRGDFDAELSGYFPAPTDPHAFTHQFLSTFGARNFGGYSNPRLDLILANGQKAASIEARSTLYRAAQQIILSDRPIIYLYNRIGYVAHSANVTGVRLFNAGASQSVTNARFK